MNITEFAEQIVFGNTLEDKLRAPGKLTHAAGRRSLPNVDSLIAPGRPVGLQMQHAAGKNIQPPPDNRLENDQARGQLLHFLANHELLATELMALVLLKFPEAPHAFRQGVLVTLQEEQEHTRMYIRQMKECGVEFGSYPLSGQFWRMIEPMQSPMDFVSRLSLTFEQANLDYSLHFASVFQRMGDDSTAAIMQKIYEDEIGHVQHGLHWFRQWKNPEQSDWEAYQESLDFPMSPQRGRGPRCAFNREGRIQAGLTDDFIDAIEVFRQSRGRAPTVRWFDPAAEAELNGPLSAREIPLMQQLGEDMECVMVAMAKQDDVVLVRRVPTRSFLKQLIDAGFDLPEFMRIDEALSLAERKIHDFAPWAWTPKNHQIVNRLLPVTHVSPPPWSEPWKDLYRKSWGANQLRDGLKEGSKEGWRDCLVDAGSAGTPVNSVDEVLQSLSDLAGRGIATAIFKQDLATSGRGQRRLRCGEPLSPQDESWLASVVAQQRARVDQRGSHTDSPTPISVPVADGPIGVVEPELDRLVDLSLLFWFPPGAEQPQYLGWTRPLVSGGRRYAGTRLGSTLFDCDSSIKRFLLADRCRRLQSLADWIEVRLTPELVTRGFSGYFGVDAMVCRDPHGNLKIKPLVELNPRMTMGHVALALGKRLEPGAEAEFRILTREQWDNWHEDLAKIPLTKIRDGRWKSGVVWLGEVSGDTKLVPVLLIGNAAIAIAAGNHRG